MYKGLKFALNQNEKGEADLFVYNIGNKNGFVIVAGDDEEDPEEAEDKADEVSEVENLRQEVETLKAQLQEAQKMAKTKDDMRILNAVKMAGGEKALKEFASNYVPAKRQRDGKKTTDTANERADVSPMRAEIEARRKGEWKKE